MKVMEAEPVSSKLYESFLFGGPQVLYANSTERQTRAFGPDSYKMVCRPVCIVKSLFL